MKVARNHARKNAILLSLLCAGSLFGIGLPAASAAPSADVGAQVTYFSIYEHDDQRGGHARFSGSDTNLSNNSWVGEPGRIVNNNASSMDNNTSRDVVMYDLSSTNCGGVTYYAQPNSEDDDLTNNGFDNKASCIRFV